ncbi:MAG TPA: hypothetical protein VF746_02695 [Longimicrobium sp.]|jgi:hypothetical protein
MSVMWEKILVFLLMTVPNALGIAGMVWAMRHVFSYRVTESGIDTYVFGALRISRLPFDDVEEPGDVRVATTKELLRTGEYWRANRMGKRGFGNPLSGTVVAIRRRGGHMFLITPPRPYLFVEEVRKRMAAPLLLAPEPAERMHPTRPEPVEAAVRPGEWK